MVTPFRQEMSVATVVAKRGPAKRKQSVLGRVVGQITHEISFKCSICGKPRESMSNNACTREDHRSGASFMTKADLAYHQRITSMIV